MTIKRNNDSIDDIVRKCTGRKPYRAAVVAKTQKAKTVLAQIKEALNAKEIGFWCVNICRLTYMFYLKNGSTIEVIDNEVYKGSNHIFHGVAYNDDGYEFIRRDNYVS